MIRKARKEDCQQIIPLIMVIMKDMELPFLNKFGYETVSLILKDGYLTEDFRYSYTRAIVEETDGIIQGVAYGFNESEESTIDEALKNILPKYNIDMNEKMFTDKEGVPGEWYLDSISVREDQRGLGVGAKLLNALPDFAKSQGATKIGLSVDDDNPRAKKLYVREGFKEVCRTVISNHSYDHLQKDI